MYYSSSGRIAAAQRPGKLLAPTGCHDPSRHSGLTAVLASGQDHGQPPWDADGVRQFLTRKRLVALRALEFLADEGLICGTELSDHYQVSSQLGRGAPRR
jgi:hypothetical protein